MTPPPPRRPPPSRGCLLTRRLVLRVAPASPCSSSNRSLKTSFLPFIIFAPPLPSAHICSSITRHRESRDPHRGWLPREEEGKKRKCVSRASLRPSCEVRGQLNADPISSTHKSRLTFPPLSSLLSGLWFHPHHPPPGPGQTAFRDEQIGSLELNIKLWPFAL